MAKRIKFKFRKPCKICENIFTPLSRSNKICESCKNKINVHLHLSRIRNSFSKVTDKMTQIPDNKWKNNLLTCKELIDNSYSILSEEIKFKQRKRKKD